MPNKNFNPEGIDYKLFTPGPVEVPQFLLDEMAKGNDTHRSKAYRDMHAEIRKVMQQLLHSSNDILLFANSATGVMEAAVRNLLGDDDIGLFFSCGAFGDRWAEIAEKCGKNIDKVQVEMGQAVTPEIVKEALGKKKYSAVFVTFNETSTGVLNPLKEIAPIVKATDALLCVDSVSAMGGVEIDVDALGLDLVLASVQKCFAVPPGLAACAISEKALAKAKTVKNRGFYLDFVEIKKKGDKNEHPVTPPIPQMRALLKSAETIVNMPAAENYKRHLARSELIRQWALSQGFELFSPEGYHSPTVVTVKNNLNIDVSKFVSELFNRGYKIVDGYGSLKQKTFRMAAMGFVSEEETKEMLTAATEALNAAKNP